jgi:hypothetical protein
LIAAHARFYSIGSPPIRIAQGEIPYLRITGCFDILSVNRCLAPGTHDRRARFAELLEFGDKLASEYGDRWMQALVSSARGVFNSNPWRSGISH